MIISLSYLQNLSTIYTGAWHNSWKCCATSVKYFLDKVCQNCHIPVSSRSLIKSKLNQLLVKIHTLDNGKFFSPRNE